jgi:hypothetical protein
MRTSDIALLLDRVAEGNAGRGRTGVECHFDFSHGGAIEVGAHGGEKPEDFGRRVCLDGIIDHAVGQGMAERLEIVFDHIEIDHEAWAVGTSGGEKVADALRHGINPSKVKSQALRHPGSNGMIAKPIGKTPAEPESKTE